MWRAKGAVLGLILGLALIAGCAHLDLEPGPSDWSVFLRHNGFMGDLAELPVIRYHRVAQVSSFDRTGGNADDSGYVSREDDRTVLADLKGPGCILRIWCANPSGQLRLFIDDDWPPLMEFPFESLFEKHVRPFRKPLVGISSGGHYSYFPIPFRERCIVEVQGESKPLCYQITYAAFDEPVKMGSFTGGLSARDRVYIRGLARSWENPGLLERVPPDVVSVESKHEVWPGASWDIAVLEGAGVIRSVWLNLTERSPEALQQTYLKFYWDGEETPSVVAPFGSFFGSGTEEKRFRSVPVGMRDDGFYCRFLMPFSRGARLALENRSEQKLDIRWAVDYYPMNKLPAGVGRFHARANAAVTEPGVPYAILETTGTGQYVGCVLNVEGKGDFSFLEGDDKIYVDGEPEPSIHGTGTEDCFNGAYYFANGTFHLPWHGLTVKDSQDSMRRISAYRFHFTDYIPFRRSFRMTIEHGARNDAPGLRYSSVAFWYQL